MRNFVKLFTLLFFVANAHAAAPKRLEYCANMISFIVPKIIDGKSIEKQSEPASCRDNLLISSKTKNRKENISRYVGYFEYEASADFANPSNWDLKNLEEFRKKISNDKKTNVHYFLSFTRKEHGDQVITIKNIYWLDESERIVLIMKNFLATKKVADATMMLSFDVDPDNADDVLFGSALEQFFLSIRINW